MVAAVQVVEAEIFHRRMKGRTGACLFSCRAKKDDELVEYVVKLKNGMETKEVGLASELVAALLATVLGIDVPASALVQIGEEISAAVQDRPIADILRGSIGLNYGVAAQIIPS